MNLARRWLYALQNDVFGCSLGPAELELYIQVVGVDDVHEKPIDIGRVRARVGDIDKREGRSARRVIDPRCLKARLVLGRTECVIRKSAPSK